MKKENIKYIHIGKCGGSTLTHSLSNNITGWYHIASRDYKNNEKYIIWIRHPLKRFVSAFWYSHDLVNFETIHLKMKDITFDNCLFPKKIKKKIKYGRMYTYSKRYDFLINYFKSPNDLAESLTSLNQKRKKLAYELMKHQTEHIFKGIGWYLYNGKFIEKNHKKILFIGTQDNMNQDLKKLNTILKYPLKKQKHIRNNNTPHNIHLSKLAIRNLKNHLKNTDYLALNYLLKYKFISRKIYNSYQIYDNIII